MTGFRGAEEAREREGADDTQGAACGEVARRPDLLMALGRLLCFQRQGLASFGRDAAPFLQGDTNFGSAHALGHLHVLRSAR
jgi:hypothetical protein